MKHLLLFIVFLWSGMHSAFALPLDRWTIIENESYITFTAKQNGQPVTGKLPDFSGAIIFEKKKLRKSNVDIRINMENIETDYDEVKKALHSEDWLNTALYRRAYFKSRDIRHIQDNHYEAHGALTIKHTTIPFLFPFTMTIEDAPENRVATLQGSVTLKRLRFSIGEGEWSNTTTVDDDVVVNVVLKASTPYK